MVKTKRAIVIDDDRYGGYIKRFEAQGRYAQGHEVQYDDAKTYDYSDLVGHSFSTEPETASQYASERQVHQIPRLQAHTIQRPSKYIDDTVAATQTMDSGRIKRNAEFMPSVKEKQKQATQKKGGVIRNASATKGLPLSLIVYITAVVVLATAVIATGLIMANVSNNASALEQSRNYLAEQLAENQAELALTYNEDTLREAAEGLGMTQTTNTYSTSLLPMSETQEYASTSNWFDRLVRFFTGQL